MCDYNSDLPTIIPDFLILKHTADSSFSTNMEADILIFTWALIFFFCQYIFLKISLYLIKRIMSLIPGAAGLHVIKS